MIPLTFKTDHEPFQISHPRSKRQARPWPSSSKLRLVPKLPCLISVIPRPDDRLHRCPSPLHSPSRPYVLQDLVRPTSTRTELPAATVLGTRARDQRALRVSHHRCTHPQKQLYGWKGPLGWRCARGLQAAYCGEHESGGAACAAVGGGHCRADGVG
jgi:hypothetical protein